MTDHHEESGYDLDLRLIDEALQQPPAVRVPAGFAAQVMAALPQRRPLLQSFTVSRALLGQRSLLASAALLLLCTFAAAPLAASGQRLWQMTEYIATAQMFALLALAAMLRRSGTR